MKKLVSIILSLLIICPLLTSCGGKGMGIGKVEQTNKELTIYLDQSSQFKYASGVYSFKKENPDIKVNIVDYSQLSLDEYTNKLSADILAGKGPDIITMNAQFFNRRDVNKMMTSGVFADLNSFTKKDKDLNKDNYNMTVIKGGEINGHQYIIPTSYRIPILFTTEKVMKEAKINLDQNKSYISLMNQIINYVQETRNKADTMRAFRLTKSMINYTNYMGLDILDYENKKVKLHTLEFKQASEKYKEIYLQEITADGEEVVGVQPAVEALYNGKTLFDNSSQSGSFDTVLMQSSAVLGFDLPIIVPIHDVDGGMQAMIDNAFAVRNNSPNQKNAYNLIKYLMSKTVQEQAYPLSIPIRNESIIYHSEHYKTNGSIKYKSSSGETKFPYKDVPSEFIQDFYELTQKTTGAYINSPVTQNKVFDGMEPYFKGERSYEECVKELQENLEIYITE